MQYLSWATTAYVFQILFIYVFFITLKSGAQSHGSLEYKNYRWRKYMEMMRKRDYLQPVYARYLCREWNRRHQGGETLDELEILYVLEWTQPVTEYSPIEKQSVHKFKCGV